MSDSDEGPRMFTGKQMASIVTAVVLATGGGAAVTTLGGGAASPASANDAVQDTKIEALESQTVRITDELKNTAREVHIVQTEVRAVRKTVDDTHDDIVELRNLVIQAIKEN